MENQTRFDLNAGIESWRQELAEQSNLASDDRRELETHLRDTIAGFQQRGLSDEESFWLARRRVGQPQQLGEEFFKADPIAIWRERVFWMWLALFLSRSLGGICTSFAAALTHMMISDSLFIPQIAYLIMSFVIPLAAVILLAKGKMIPQFSRLMLLIENRRRLAIAVSVCVVLSSTIRLIINSMMLEKINHHSTASVWQIVTLFLYALVTGVILVWLLPAQNRKMPKRA